MTAEQLERLGTDEEFRKRLAKYLAQQCFRNSGLENLHAGKVPGSRTGDYTDVKVVTPYGKIAWRDLSRFDDQEMKALMIEVVDRTYAFLSGLFGGSPTAAAAVLYRLEAGDMVPRWNDPETTEL